MECPGLAEPVAEAAEQVQGLVLAGRGGRVVARLPLQHAEFAQDVGLVKLGPEHPEQFQRPLVAGRRGRVVAGHSPDEGQVGEGDGLGQRSLASRARARRCWWVAAAAG